MRPQDKWDYRFLCLAREVASWSKDPGTQVGAVIVRPDRTVASMGYNGLPRVMSDDFLLEAYRVSTRDASDAFREEKLARTIHAEMNAVLTAKEPLAGFTCYIWPILCCERCFVHLLQAGITRIVAPINDPVVFERWQASFKRVRDWAEKINSPNGLVSERKITLTEVHFDNGN